MENWNYLSVILKELVCVSANTEKKMDHGKGPELPLWDLIVWSDKEKSYLLLVYYY